MAATVAEACGGTTQPAAATGQCRVHQHVRFRCVAVVRLPTADLQRMAADIDAKRAAGQPTVPSLLSDERKCNPFLRPSEFAGWGGVWLWLQLTMDYSSPWHWHVA